MAENNWALKLDSVDQDRVTLSTSFDIKNLSQFTFEAWVKPGANATSSNQRAFSIRQGGSKRSLRFACVPIRGKLRFEFARADGTSDTNYSIAHTWDDYWHHVAFTVDVNAKQYNIYIDGGLVQTGRIVDGGSSLAVSNTTASAVTVGAWSPTTTEADFIYWDGKIDNIRLWSTVRTQQEITDNKDDHILTSTTGLIDEWRFNEGSGTTTASAKNAYVGTLYRSGGVATQAHWNIDRPFLGDGVNDVDPPSDPTMTAPTGITSDGFTLNWTGSIDDVSVQYYEITVATDSAFASTVTGYSGLNVGLVLTQAISDLSPSTNYYARVRAFDAAGNASAYVTYNSNAAITTSAAVDLTPPATPVAISADAVSDTGLTARWNAATDNVAVTGYKLDVAYDAAFTNFLGGYRNLDVGNVLTYTVTGTIDPSTTYYYRVRAYDSDQNESADSNTVTVTTAAPPDTEAPSIVVTQAPTSVGSTSFTARWNVGVDNVGVTGYLLDVATDEEFLTYVSGYQNLDVGNVTSYGLNFLTPQTGYYYRVRAYDAAGNISENTTLPEAVTTRASTVDEGGTTEVTHFAVEDTFVSQAAPSINYATNSTLQSDGSSDGNGKKSYLSFDLREMLGTLVNADLRLYVQPSGQSIGLHTIQRVSGTIDAGLITWSSDTSVLTGPTVDFIPSTQDAFVEVDIASLISGPDLYWFQISTTSTDGALFNSLEATENQPHLIVESDPTSSTEVDQVGLSTENVSYTNLLKNPSAEVGGTAFGGTTGITKVGAATLLQDSTFTYDGTYACKVTTTTVAGDGVKFESPAALSIAGTSQTIKGLLHVRAGAKMTLSAKLRLTYTDATTTDGPSVSVAGHTYFRAFEVSAVATSGKTVDKVEVFVTDGTTTAQTFWVDAVVAAVTSGVILYVDGDSHPTDADWDGTANASTSTYAGIRLDGAVTYLGDGDQDNSVVVRYKRTDAADWIAHPVVVPSTNRTTKEVTASVGPLMVGNYLNNPRFGNGSDSPWGDNTSGITRTLLADQVGFDGDDTWGVLQVVTDGLFTTQGVGYFDYHVLMQPAETWTFSVYLKGAVGGEKIKLRLIERDLDLISLSVHDGAEITLTTDWVRYDFTTTIVYGAQGLIQPYIVTSGTLAQTFFAHAVQLEKGAVANPYVDGTQTDGLWAGRTHTSATYRNLSHEASYDVEFEFTDPDGIIGANPVSATALTAAAPDDPLTAVGLTLTPSNDEIAVIAAYTGDDNLSATAVVEFKRSDLATWSAVSNAFDRDNHQVLATVANLKPGTDYDVRVTFTDLDDGVYGPNPLQSSVTTTITGLTAATKEKISFGGFVLSGDDDSGFLISEHDAFSHPERLTQIEQLPRADGAVELSDWWGKRVIKMKGVLVGRDRNELANRIKALRKAMAPRQQRLVIDTLEATNYFFTATCTSLGVQEIGGETIRHLPFDLEFTCADPFRYEAFETTESDIILFNAEEVVITNDGDLAIDPIITITTTSSTGVSLTLVNETTGERITPEGTISNGDRLIINSSTLSVTKNGVEIDYAGGFPRLAVGQNTISVVLSSGSVSLTVRRRHRFL